MRRWPSRLLGFVIAGAALNLLVAVGCAVGARPSDWWGIAYGETLPAFVTSRIPAAWEVQTDESITGMEIDLFRASSFGRSSFVLYIMTPWKGPQSWMVPDYRVHVERCGWPLQSMECVAALDVRGTTGAERFARPTWRGGVTLPDSLVARDQPMYRQLKLGRALPCTPMPVPFAINTVFYAVAAWGTTFAIARRRWCRRPNPSTAPGTCRGRIGVALMHAFIGIALTIGIAWACALWAPITDRWRLNAGVVLPIPQRQLVPPAWLVQPKERYAQLFESLERLEARGWTLEVVETSVHHAGAMKMGPDHVLCIYSAGWPLRSFQCHAIEEQPQGIGQKTPSAATSWHDGIAAPLSLKPRRLDVIAMSLERAIPMRVLWPAAIANVLFFAAASAIVFRIPRRVRQSLRRKRSACVSCGYPIGSSPICTECGVLIEAKPTVATVSRIVPTLPGPAPP